MTKAAKVALLGFGTVGRAVATALAEQGPTAGLRVVAVVDRSGALYDPAGLDLAAAVRAKAGQGLAAYPDATARRHWSAAELLERHGGDLDLVAELTPSDLRDGRDALARVEAALAAGADVASANKGPFALHWGRVHAAAASAGRRVRCSATVCGAVPVLEVGEAAFAGDRLLQLEGVLNGSTNSILCALEEGRELEDALRAARLQGLLEEDASLDLLGIDARAKACILANALFGRALRLEDVPGEGILGVSRREAQEARARGTALRLLARIDARDAGVRVVEIPRDHPLRTDGTENAVRLRYELAGTVLLRGAGAGARETASAVLSDLWTLARQRAAHQQATAPAVAVAAAALAATP